uniref:superoxide dismutase n=1 Tax=Chrysomela lapponica TaxID=153811 RepID=A0A0S2A4D4_CHRLA|nr:putative copper/zinc superoxide dismutase [Chrysomela lapponica]ALN12443.1 putative copper/zinc superoxide dismutase [Chrysomela lapponica]
MFKVLLAAAILSFSCHLCNCAVKTAYVHLRDPSGSTEVTGELNFTQTANGVRIHGKILGIHEGLHGGHVHESANIGRSCAGAGGVFNPHNVPHGSPKDKIRTVGDLGNVVADEYGVAVVDFFDDLVRLNTDVDGVIGRSYVIHEKEDDLGRGNNKESKTNGNCGGLIACGVIEVLEED